MRVICESLRKLLPHFAIIVILKYVIFLNRHSAFCEEFIFIYSLFYFIHYLNSTTRFYTRFFIRNTRLKLAEIQANVNQHPEPELLLFENYSHSSAMFSSKNNRTYPK